MPTADDTRLSLTSRDVNAERVARLRELFPDAFTEGRLDLHKLSQLLGEAATDAPERYGLSWAGKSDAIRNIQTLTSGTLLPCPEESWPPKPFAGGTGDPPVPVGDPPTGMESAPRQHGVAAANSSVPAVQSGGSPDGTGPWPVPPIPTFNTSENLILEGDNLEVLKLLQGGCHGRVKMIYIDPPYNTGNEFIYPDNYTEGLADYLRFSGQVSGEGIRLTTNAETDGRYHSKWLAMMYPRLFLARNLLREDGVIFVSIDDHEVHNLRAVMNEIFGEENLIAQLVWEKGRKNDAKLFSVGHEYMLVYGRSVLSLRERKTVWREEKPGARDIWNKYLELRERHGGNHGAIERDLASWYASLPKSHPAKKWSRYKRVDANGPWRDRDISWPGGGGPRYDVLHPETGLPCAVPERGWIYSQPVHMQRMIKLGLVEFREDHTSPPFRKAHIRPLAEELEAEGDLDDEEGDQADEGFATQVRGSYFYKQAQVSVKYLRKLLGGKIFNNPKDHEEIAKLIKYVMGTETSGIVLDFFAGSGTTAQAVLELNAEDGGDRRFILVQLPEPTGRPDFPTIADITKERVRRVIQKLEAGRKEAQEAQKKEEAESLFAPSAPSRGHADLGFKVFKLAASNFKVWDAATAPTDAAGLAEQLQMMADNVFPGRPDAALLYELILKSNLPLSSRVVEVGLGEQTFYDVAAGTLAICLARPVTRETLRGLIARKPRGVICLDLAFAGNDQLKANIVLEMKAHDIEFHTA